MSEHRDSPPTEDRPPGISGKWVLVALLLASVLVVIVGLLVVRPDPDAPPAPPSDRPFGPGKSHPAPVEQDLPLLQRSGSPDEPDAPADTDPP